MRLSPPKQIVFWVSVVLVVLGILSALVAIPVLSGIAFWLVVAGYVLLMLGNTMTGF